MWSALRFVNTARRASSLCPFSGLPTSTVSISRIEPVRSLMQQPHAQFPLARTSLTTSRSRGTRDASFRRTSSSLSKASEHGRAPAIDSMSHMERLKDQWRKYGVVAIGTYLSMYGAVLGSIYLAIDRGWIHTNKRASSTEEEAQVDSFNLVTTTNRFVELAEDLGIAQYLEVERVNAKTGSFLLAWIATKFTEPVRLALTIAMTPRIARFLGRAPKLPPKAPGKLASMMKKQQATKEQ